MTKESLTELKKELAAINHRRDYLINEIDLIEQSKALPELIKKYKGKYFKYINRSAIEKWPIYIYLLDVKLVKSFPRYIVNSFEHDLVNSDHIISYEKEISESLIMNSEEIKPIEYARALNKF